ncbi:cytochrome P450 monooxygenase, partial [Fomitopsis betulina]
LLAVLVLALVRRLLAQGHRHKLPPGPEALPLVGNLHRVPREYQAKTFSEWAKKYGDLMVVKFFTSPFVIINSQKIANELLDKRGRKYSSRPRLVMMTEILGWDLNVVFLPYDNDHRRKQRQWIHGAFGDRVAIQRLDALRERETCILLSGLIHTPESFKLHVKRYMAALIMESVYGHRIVSLDDPYIDLIDRAMEAQTSTQLTGSILVDFFPFLKYMPAWLPGMEWKRAGLRARSLIDEAKTRPYVMARDAVLAGEAKPSFISALIEEAVKEDRLAKDEPDIINASGALYAGYGCLSLKTSFQTKTSILTFILLMVLHPQIYAKAQEEVDRVVGTDRLPTFADMDSLPYVNCIIKEVFRWNPPIPLSIPHQLTEDDEYCGFDIPRDTSIIANLWSMAHSDDIYGDPEAFRPERFLEKNLLAVHSSDPSNIIFGHGRRLCPGRLFAETTVFLAISNMLATLDIKKARDSQGNEITPNGSFSGGLTSSPHDFMCSITPRSAKAANLVTDSLSSD